MMKGIRGLLEKDFRLFLRQGGNLFLVLAVVAIFFILCVQRSWTTLAGESPVTVIASEPCS